MEQRLYERPSPGENGFLQLDQSGEAGDTHLKLFASTHDDDAIEIREAGEARKLAYYLNAFADWAELWALGWERVEPPPRRED